MLGAGGGPRTTDANLDCAFVENALFYTDPWFWKVNRTELNQWPDLVVTEYEEEANVDDFELDPAQLEDNQDLLDQQQQILIDEAVRMEGKGFFWHAHANDIITSF